MSLFVQVLEIVSITAFFFYGLSCLFSNGMIVEFERFGLGRFRRLVGALEVLGSLGLVAGFFMPGVTLVASAGLTLLMILGVITRFRVGDPPVAALPALVLLVVNAFIFFHAARPA